MDPYLRFAENIKLVPYIAHKALHRPLGSCQDDEDLLQIGYIGLWNACLTFKEELGYKFSSYAAKCIANDLYAVMRKQSKQLDTVSLEEIVDMAGESDSAYGRALTTNPNDMIKYIQIKEIIQTLTPKEKEVFKALYGGQTQAKIAKTSDTSRQYINYIYQSIKNKFKEVL